MADLNVNSIGDASGGTTTTVNGFTPTVSNMAGRNRIQNGAMMIDQRNEGASVTPTDGQYTLDRYQASLNVPSKFSIQRSTVAPSGFVNSLLVTSLSAYSLGAGEVTGIVQKVEGFNVADLGWGTANARTVTLSFWVRSSLTGTFGGSFRNNAANRSYPFAYTISTADTWEQKSVTLAGDTSGSWLTDNGVGVQLYFAFGAGATYSATAGSWQAGNFISATGATSVVGTSGATFYITGVQLEEGSVATPFCPAGGGSYGAELALCQRYTYRHSAEGDIDNFAPLGMGRYYATNAAQLYVPFKVTMRVPPTSVTQVGNVLVNDTGFGGSAITLALNERSSSGATVTGTATTGTTAGYATTFYADNTSNAALIFSAEL